MKTENYDSTSTELKPCPFCGGTPIWHHKGNDFTPSRTIVIECKPCNISMQIKGRLLGIDRLEDIIVKKWNNRN